MPDLVGTAGKYVKDLVERVLFTAVATGGGLLVASGPAGLFEVTFWEGVGTAALASAVTLVKGVLARGIGNKDSASAAPGV